ncbi:MAG: GNAT family N-acetyltransferase [Clostridia bacterium]|nr:GNAT family N-acetyltransferase [Clostridia bacterium]
MGCTVKIKTFDELTGRELYESMRLRQDVFVLEQTCLYPDLDGRDYDCWHALAFNDSTSGGNESDLVGYIRILPAGQTFDTVAIGRVLTRETQRGEGVARQLMEESLHYIRDVLGETHVKLSAQQYLIKFYESLGFKIISEGYLEDGIPHIDMETLL